MLPRSNNFGSYRNGFQRPSSNGHFGHRFNRPQYGHARFNNTRRPKGNLGSDTSIFIKKAKDVSFDNGPFKPQNNFTNFAFSEILKQNIINKGYKDPTPIQDQAIRPILEGRDLIGIANTGTGKTAAFLLPIIDKIYKNRDVKAVVIVPTRELAVQINDELRSFSTNMKIYSSLIIGGRDITRQIQEVRRNPHVVIGTPGRLQDLIERRVLRLDDFSIFVLDEVDLMVDIGFLSYVKYFISMLPAKRQSLFFSATIPSKIQALLQSFVKDPITVSVKLQDTAENIDQDIVRLENGQKKIDKLHDLLITEGFDKVLVFGRTKHGVEKLNQDLTFKGFKVGAIHGNKRQGHRQRTLQSFKSNQIQILLATDVASRGLDIDNVTHVINYDLPETYEDYVHRIGRTGRANKRGIALTFVD